jgi:hypothetical protein
MDITLSNCLKVLDSVENQSDREPTVTFVHNGRFGQNLKSKKIDGETGGAEQHKWDKFAQ